MATAATGWYCACSASVTAQTDTTATITVYCYWQNNGWNYNINFVSAWVYCNGTSYQVKNSGSVNSTSSNTAKVSCGSYSFVVNKSTASQSIPCYAKITSNSSYVSGTKTSSTINVAVSAKTSYTISYSANGGSGAPSAQTKYYGTALTLSSTKPTRSGYTFKGWATSASGSVAYAPGATYPASSNTNATLYAVWQAKTYTVSYNANGGSGAPSNQTKTYNVALKLSSTIPTRTNYNFLGWGTSAGATTVSYAPGASYTTNAKITLYAIWELAYLKPRITNVTVARCDSAGNSTESGTYAKASFKWATDETVSSATIYWKLVTESNYTVDNSKTVAVSGTSGTVTDEIFGGGNLVAENMYDVLIAVVDKVDSSGVTRTLQGTSFPIDVLAGGSGLAIGKAATIENTLDIYKRTIVRGNADASGTTASGQLIIGDPQALHIAFDNNEIMAKSNATTPSQLNVNSDGGNVVIGGDTILKGEQYLNNNKNIYCKTTGGSEWSVVKIGDDNRIYYGLGSYDGGEGGTRVHGQSIALEAKDGVWITSPATTGANTRRYGENIVLWTGGWYMNASQTLTLNQAVSAQPNGIVLVFSYYNNGNQDSHFVHFFVAKEHVKTHPGAGSVFRMARHNVGNPCSKYLYINDTTITGHADNNSSDTIVTGLKFAGIEFVLRYVYGV